MDEQFELFEETIQEAIDLGSKGTANAHTASGMAVQLTRRLQDLDVAE
jgi:hypothetical protein